MGAIATRIHDEVSSWEGVETKSHRFGGVEFVMGRIEIGHIHGDKLADLPFPKKVRDELIATGRASVHQPLPNSGWVRKWIGDEEDVEDVVDLFRMNYERVTRRRTREPGS